MKVRIKQLLKLPEWNKKRLAEELEVSPHTVQSWIWKNGNKIPNKWLAPKIDELLTKYGI